MRSWMEPGWRKVSRWRSTAINARPSVCSPSAEPRFLPCWSPGQCTHFQGLISLFDSPPGSGEGGQAFWFLWDEPGFLKNDHIHLSAQEAAKQVFKGCPPCFQAEKLTKPNNKVLIDFSSYWGTNMLTLAFWTLTSAVGEDLYLVFL